MNILQQVPLAQYTTWKVGGNADYYCETRNIDELKEAMTFAHNKKLPISILGQGSNVLISDKGIKGIVIRNKLEKIDIASISGKRIKGIISDSVSVRCQSGVLLNRLVRFTLNEGLSGLENFLGQPGTVGGAIYINAHNIHKKDYFGNHVISVELLHADGTITIIPKEYMNFGYDKSRIQKTHEFIVSVVIKLIKSKHSKELLWKEAEEEFAFRTKSQPVGFGTAGCTFRNIQLSDALRLGTPNHTQSAGFLIDACGLKGYEIGGARISKTHANFIENTKNAKAIDIYKLISYVKQVVQDKFGILLQEEIVYLGVFS